MLVEFEMTNETRRDLIVRLVAPLLSVCWWRQECEDQDNRGFDRSDHQNPFMLCVLKTLSATPDPPPNVVPTLAHGIGMRSCIHRVS